MLNIYKDYGLIIIVIWMFLQIARNVIDEKENNMKSLRESLKVEKEQKAKLQKVRHLVDFLWSCMYLIELKVKIVTPETN